MPSTPQDYDRRSAAGEPFYIDEAFAGVDRLAAEVFLIDGQLYAIDTGWSEPMNSTHPIHAVPFDDLAPLPAWHPLTDAWQRWKAYQARHPGNTRAEARLVVERHVASLK